MLNVKQNTIGKWTGILSALGIDPAILVNKHQPCPICGGKDRFRFDNKEGRGTFFCSHCGAGDGFDLVRQIRGISFRDAAAEVERIVGSVRAVLPAPTFSDADKITSLRRVWADSKLLQHGDEAMTYFTGRGITLDVPPLALRLHPGLTYRDEKQIVGKFHALLARVTDSAGSGVSIHRTYLENGRKAQVPSPKKLMPAAAPVSGAAIRLFPPAPCLGIAEGIETALAAHMLFGIPTWACVSAHGIETFMPPVGVEKVIIFADNDSSGTGQAAAWSLAKRLIHGGILADVRIPDHADTDFADFMKPPVSRYTK